jgi:hypothetical protein
MDQLIALFNGEANTKLAKLELLMGDGSWYWRGQDFVTRTKNDDPKSAPKGRLGRMEFASKYAREPVS